MAIKKSAILFDLDGVTIDTEPLYSRAEKRLFSEYGITIPNDDWSLFKGCSEEQFFTLTMNRYHIKEDRDIFMKRGRKYVMDEFNNNLSFIPGFKSLINRISNFYFTGLVTASPIHTLSFIQNKLTLHNFFDYIISGEQTIKNKPHPHPYLEMMKKINIKPRNTIIIEDSVIGLQSAISSGAHVVALMGSVDKEKLNNAHRIVSHLDQMTIQFIEELLLERF